MDATEYDSYKLSGPDEAEFEPILCNACGEEIDEDDKECTCGEPCE